MIYCFLIKNHNGFRIKNENNSIYGCIYMAIINKLLYNNKFYHTISSLPIEKLKLQFTIIDLHFTDNYLKASKNL
jgi:hypothetical protein